MLPTRTDLDGRQRLQLPDVLRPDLMPSLPEWVVSRIGLLKPEVQPDQTGQRRQVLTLSKMMMLTAGEREEIERHVRDLRRLLVRTPTNSAEARNEVLQALTKMIFAFPLVAQNELTAEARGEAFLIALEDLPVWAVGAAIRNWFRGTCGTNERGEPYDYKWPPAPADIRRISWSQTLPIRNRTRTLDRLLAAEVLVEFSEEHRSRMLTRLAHFLKTSGTPPVGSNGSGGTAGQKPADGAHCGTRPKAKPGLKREGGRRRRGYRRK